MIKQVNFIGEFDTSMGHLVIVNSDQSYKIGQTIENNGKRYSIKGFPLINNAKPDTINMIVSEIQ